MNKLSRLYLTLSWFATGQHPFRKGYQSNDVDTKLHDFIFPCDCGDTPHIATCCPDGCNGDAYTLIDGEMYKTPWNTGIPEEVNYDQTQ